MAETRSEVSNSEVTKPKLSKSHKDSHKTHDEHKKDLVETPFDKELNLKLNQLNDRILKTKANKTLPEDLVEQEFKRKNRNLKLEKISDKVYNVNSFWFSTQFIIDNESSPVKYSINKWEFSKIDKNEIATISIDKILELSNQINYWMFFIQNAIKENPNYLDSDNKYSNIFHLDEHHYHIFIKAVKKKMT